jgi:hypothetical protein
MNVGETFRGDPDLSHNSVNAHLWIIVAIFQNNLDEDQAVIVNVTTSNSKKLLDPACQIVAGDHEFIQHDSYVYYAKAKEIDLSVLNTKISSGEFEIRDPLSEKLLKKVQQGFHGSKFVSPKIRSLVDNPS